MNTKHTPGPWAINDDLAFALPDRPYPVGKLFYTVADVGNEADARLISAAPDMLAVLIRVLNFEQRLMACKADGGAELVSDIRAALAKAEGGA